MQREGRTWEPAVAAGRVDAAAASDMFVPVMKTGGGGHGKRDDASVLAAPRREGGRPESTGDTGDRK